MQRHAAVDEIETPLRRTLRRIAAGAVAFVALTGGVAACGDEGEGIVDDEVEQDVENLGDEAEQELDEAEQELDEELSDG